MRRLLRWIGNLLLVVLLIAAMLVALNWDRLVRLNAVNTLFSEEKIVSNFSNMRSLFFNADIPSSGTTVPWQEAPKSMPESFVAAGVERNLDDWLEETRTTALLVIQDGKIAHETYYLDTGPDDLRISWSVAKSFLSAAFGVAVSEGKIDLEEPVEAYVPEFSDSGYARRQGAQCT